MTESRNGWSAMASGLTAAAQGAVVAGHIAATTISGAPVEAAIRHADLDPALEQSAITLVENLEAANEADTEVRRTADETSEDIEGIAEPESAEHRGPERDQNASGVEPDAWDQADDWVEPTALTESAEVDDWAEADEWSVDTKAATGSADADDWTESDTWSETEASAEQEAGPDVEAGDGAAGRG